MPLPAHANPFPAAAPAAAARVPRALLVALAVLALLCAALAGALGMQLLGPASPAAPSAPAAAPAGLLAAAGGGSGFEPLPTFAAGVQPPANGAAPAAAVPPEATATPQAGAPRTRPAPRPVRTEALHRVAYTAPTAPAPARARASACAGCGVVESVAAVRTEGPASGLGAVAGGVLGGLLGNQVGGGNGRKAMTVLGAVGGGFAGHEVEKRVRADTVYEVRVRMDDGSRRTLRRAAPPAVGTRLVLDRRAG